MNHNKDKYKILIAAGGTGGHLFPALAVVDELITSLPEIELLFTGNSDRIEGNLIPRLGYRFESIPMRGMPRKVSLKFISFFIDFVRSLFKLLKIFSSFKPDLVLATGGYISVPSVLVAILKRKNIIMIEPNSYPGIATKTFAAYADIVFLSFEKAADYLKNKKNINFSGTPVRKNLILKSRSEAAEYFGFEPDKKTILILGGSLGARSINQKISEIIDRLTYNYQVIWQCGKYYYPELSKQFSGTNLFITDFLDRMDLAYSLSDLLISRAGASTISEITLYGLASILIPSPNVAENHQYYNACSLADRNAALLINDNEPSSILLEKINEYINDEHKLNELKKNSLSMSRPEAAKQIAAEIKKLLKRKVK